MSRVANYIQGTIGITLILSLNKSGNTKCCVNAMFSVHKDMSIHTGGFVTMGTGGAWNAQ